MRTDSNLQGHVEVSALSLFARGDLPLLTRCRVRLHLRRCIPCQEQVEQFQSAANELRREANGQTLTGYEAIADWNRLEHEMLGNIAVGVAAARCIDHVGRRRVYCSKWAVLSLLGLLFVAGWFTHIPSDKGQSILTSFYQFLRTPHSQGERVFLRTTAAGIAVRAQGTTLTIMNPPSAVITSFGNSAVSARFVDEETGQVTITRVYAQ